MLNVLQRNKTHWFRSYVNRFFNMPIYPPKRHKHALNIHKYKPGGLLGTEMTQGVVLWVPGRSWSCVAAPGSQTYMKKKHGEKVFKRKYEQQVTIINDNETFINYW